MKQFFISFFGTIAGILASVFLLCVIVASIIAGTVSSFTEEKGSSTKDNSVLHLKLDHDITERASKNPFESFKSGSFSFSQAVGLDDVLANIEQAKTDDHIKGIYLDLSIISAGIATVEEIRNKLLEFKKSGKFIISYSENYNQKSYYLSTVADQIYLNPQGSIEWKGLSAQVMFFKGTLDKLEIDAQIFRHGKFKSAVEPYDLEKMSSANREQTMTYVGSIWSQFVNGVATQRKLSSEKLNRMADELLIQTAEDAIKYQLADELKYKDEVLADLKKRLKMKEKDKINFSELKDDASIEKPDKTVLIKQKIAVIYAEGVIESGEGGNETMGSEKISRTIREARMDSNVKAIVLRVNSPGGSALASDVIWREVALSKKVKPVVVSMGDVAASGGYYIACAADAIIAQPNTITGSIGVFGILPNAQKLLSHKLGITVDTVNTNKHADAGSVFRPLSPEEGAVIQKSIEKIYSVFITKVAEGRKMKVTQVDSIGEGRVWSGIDAKRIGLVDELGGIELAIQLAAKKAKIEKYKILSLPKLESPFEKLIRDFSAETESRILKNELGEQYKYYKYLKNSMNIKGVQARMPYDVIIY